MNNERLFKVLLSPRVSEKVASLESKRQYAFTVTTDATKPEIAAAVKLLFGVDVIAVRVCNAKGKTRRFGGILGQRKNWKKAYITLKNGQAINFSGAGA